MKIILSRKGFDSSAGGKPSPIFPDGRMMSLPIPDRQSPVRYEDIHWQEYAPGPVVADLTSGRIPGSSFAHLDPDLNPENLKRAKGWRPIFGQTGAAQGHLRNNGVGPGDIFLFFGLFRHVILQASHWKWDPNSAPNHVLWGWLQINEVLDIAGCDRAKYSWAEYHPHFHRAAEANNTLYIASTPLDLPGAPIGRSPGAGIFGHFSKRLQLTAEDSNKASTWELPQWFYPNHGKQPLTYHSDLARWQRTESGTRLNTVSRGQEFILEAEEYPEAVGWLKSLLENS